MGARSTARRLAAIVLATLAPNAASAQSERHIGDQRACPRCEVTVRGEHVLTGSRGVDIPAGIQAVRVDQRGRFWVLAGDEPPLMFDSAGRLLGRVGRKGAGPGEFVRPRDMVPVGGDSVLVLDAGAARFSLWSADLKPGRTIAVEGFPTPLLVEDWPAAILGSGSVGSPSGAGWPLHRLDLSGQVAEWKSSFGPDDGAVRPGEYWRLAQVLAPARGGGFWAADEAQYRVGRWDWPSRRVFFLRRTPDWFPGTARRALGTPRTAPSPAVSAMHEDDDGLLWVFLRVPAPDWPDAWPRAAHEGGEVDYRQLDLSRLFDSIIEVIDPRSGALMASERVAEWVIASLPGGRIAAVEVDADGATRVRVSRVGLRRR
ncbi:MAG: hypothetical protein IT361_13945 [Gemmatimonadaceae bacterium]|nr:hypothetical protein [Gemmatimonadaceae bacterium]